MPASAVLQDQRNALRKHWITGVGASAAQHVSALVQLLPAGSCHTRTHNDMRVPDLQRVVTTADLSDCAGSRLELCCAVTVV
jgi:hypothetical protein